MEVKKALTSADKKRVTSFKLLLFLKHVWSILTFKTVNAVITPTPWGFAAHPACRPLGNLWQVHACTPTWGWRASLLPGNTGRSLPSCMSGDSLFQTCAVLPGSEGEGHQNALDSGARRGQAKLHSAVIHQVELHISTINTQQSTLPLNPLEGKWL